MPSVCCRSPIPVWAGVAKDKEERVPSDWQHRAMATGHPDDELPRPDIVEQLAH